MYNITLMNGTDLVYNAKTRGFDPINKYIKRYPTKFVQTTYNINQYKKHEYLDDDILNEIVTTNYEKIKKLFDELNYTEISSLLYGSKQDNTIILYELTKYCVLNSDIEFLLVIVKKNESYSDYLSYIPLIIFLKDDYEQIYKIVDYLKDILPDTNYEEFIDDILYEIIDHEDAIKYLDMIVSMGHKIDEDLIARIFEYNNITLAKYLIENNYDIPAALNYNFETTMYLCFDIPMLKLIMEYNIDISGVLETVFYNSIYRKNLDVLIMIVENYPQCNINGGFIQACCHNNIDAMKYLLKVGASINSLTDNVLYNASIDTINFLIQIGYYPGKTVLNNKLLKPISICAPIDNLLFFINHGADPQHIFNIDTIYNGYKGTVGKVGTMQINSYYLNIPSPLEYIVSVGNMEYIKYFTENHYNLCEPELNRLFVIACANGRCDIAKYLLGFDNGTMLSNIKCLIMACFCGHMDIVLLLLQWGQRFEDIEMELFTVVKDGYFNICGDETYLTIIDNDPTFRNDVYAYGNDHLEILKLLIKHYIPIPNFTHFDLNNTIFFDIDIIKYFIERGMDINIKYKYYIGFEEKECNLLETSILRHNINITEYLLKSEFGLEVTNLDVFEGHNHPDEYKKLLTFYGIDICL
jgi:ankyrin repeat protein